MTHSKTITIEGGALGGPCDLTLAFVPPNADFNSITPIAWKVFTLNDNGSFSWSWNDALAASRAVIDTNTGLVAADQYTPISRGQTTDLLLDRSKRPPEHYFTTPVTYQHQQARVMNRTGGYVDVGAGFITDLDGPNEEMNPVIVLRRLADQSPGFVNYTPVLKLWASLDYEESQLLDGSIHNVQPLWEGTLSQITGPLVNITVKRVDGMLVADGPLSLGPVPASSPFPPAHNRPYTYTVELVFDNPSIVVEGVTGIVNELMSLGYQAKFTQKGHDPEGALELTLPPIVSCYKAELDTIAAIEAKPTPYGKAYIRSHSGAMLVAAHNGFQRWVDISPGSLGWFNTLPFHEDKY
ncbi:hypothetical protein C8Q77DRAFT_371929 [Trametes polyzona]|nr:hypothetical protein C8Q77DRAFT_371929 [Trametes polyzona]